MIDLNPQSGNALFLILIAVILFGVLTVAISMSDRSNSGENIDEEGSRIAASQITQHGVDLERAVVLLRISRSVADNQISFEAPGLPTYVNPDCTADTCKVFTPAGGQASYIKPKDDWLDPTKATMDHFGSWLITGSTCIPGIGKGADATCNADPTSLEIVAFIPWVTRKLCIEINKQLSVPLNNGLPIQVAGSLWSSSGPEFTGTYGNGEALIDAAGAMFNRPEGCVEGAGTPPAGSYHYYRVLFPR